MSRSEVKPRPGSRRARALAVAAACVAAAAVAVGCGSGDNADSATQAAAPAAATAADAGAATTGAATTDGAADAGTSSSGDQQASKIPGLTPERQAALDIIPESVRSNYDGYWYFTPLDENPYESWTPPKPPWKFCYSDSYQGNDWRKTALAQYQSLVQKLEQKGLAKGGLTVTNSNNDINTQLAQINNLVSQGCDVIEAIPASATGLCSAAKNALDHGVLFITMEGPLMECKYAINVDFNEYQGGQVTAKWLADAMGGKGNVMLVNGIPGLPPTIARRQAVLDTFKTYPDIKVAGEVTGQWTPSVAKAQVLKFLSTHPQKIDGAWNSSQMMAATGEAFRQSGRPLPKINGFSGDCAELAYWKQNDMQSFALNQAGAPAMYEGVHVALRMLAGQKPVANSLLYPIPEITQENFNDWYTPDMTLTSTCFSAPKDGRAVADSYFDVLFKGGEPAAEVNP